MSSNSNDQDAYRKTAVELRILEGTAETLQSRLNLVTAYLTELNIAKTTLEGIEKETPDTSLFVPIGGGSYIKAKLECMDKVIVGAGAGVSIERTMTEAKETIQSRIGELEKNRTSIQQQLVQVVERINEDRDQLQDLSVKISQAGRMANVSEAERRP